MTVRAARLTQRAKTDHARSALPSLAASNLGVFIDAMERLGYRMERLLAEGGIHRTALKDPDARIPRAVWGPVFGRALEQRPMKNAGMRLATVTPFGAFPLIDYLIATSESVGEGVTRLGRYLRLAEARSVPCAHEDEDPILVSLEGSDTPFSAEFTVTLNLLHFREQTKNRFRAAYVSFCHTPDDVDEMERVLDCPVHPAASWNGWALARETWQLPLRRRDRVLSTLLPRQADEAMARIPPVKDVAADVRLALAARLAGDDTRLKTIARALATSTRSLQRRLAAAESPTASCSIWRARRQPSATCATRGSRLARWRTCLVIRNLPPSIERSGDGAMKDRRRSVSANGEAIVASEPSGLVQLQMVARLARSTPAAPAFI